MRLDWDQVHVADVGVQIISLIVRWVLIKYSVISIVHTTLNFMPYID